MAKVCSEVLLVSAYSGIVTGNLSPRYEALHE